MVEIPSLPRFLPRFLPRCFPSHTVFWVASFAALQSSVEISGWLAASAVRHRKDSRTCTLTVRLREKPPEMRIIMYDV